MKVDAATLVEAADAHDERMNSMWWALPEGRRDDNSWTGALTDGVTPKRDAPRQQPMVRAEIMDGATPTNAPQLGDLARNVKQLAETIHNRPIGSEDMPGWLMAAGGDPRTYDSPDSTRMNVCARIRPATYARLKDAQQRMGLRTLAGAWEFFIRLGIATSERLTFR